MRASVIDSALLHIVAAAEAARGEDAHDVRQQALGAYKPAVLAFPLLIRVGAVDWTPPDGCRMVIDARVGDVVSGRCTAADIELLDADPGVLGVEASYECGGSDTADSVLAVGAQAVHRGPGGETGDRALVAIIDGGIDVLHEAFADSQGTSRLIGIWDQTDDSGPPPPGMRLGTIHSGEDIARYVASRTVPRRLGRDNGKGQGHGTHVTSIAAGRKAGDFAGGIAPDARLFVVKTKLTVEPGDPLSIGYSSSHVAALQLIEEIAVAMDLPVVVNVSQGMNVGAHDGTSPLEAAFDNFTHGGRKFGRTIVKSAGNDRDKRRHAAIKLAPRATWSLQWEVNAAPRHGTRMLDVWFDSADTIEFRLLMPGGRTSAIVSPGHPVDSGVMANGNGYRINYVRYHHDNGASRLTMSVEAGTSPLIEPGVWTLEITPREVRSRGSVLHAWLERGTGIAFTNHSRDDMTLTVPATAHTVIAVGAIAKPKADGLLLEAGYTAHGPTRDGRNKPELSAPGSRIAAAAAGTRSGVTIKSGSSMAAPHVAGAVALLYSRHHKLGRKVPNAAQVRAVVSQFAAAYDGEWQPGRGYGVLDVEALMSAFDDVISAE